MSRGHVNEIDDFFGERGENVVGECGGRMWWENEVKIMRWENVVGYNRSSQANIYSLLIIYQSQNKL